MMKKMRRVFRLFAAFILLLSSVGGVSAENEGVSLVAESERFALLDEYARIWTTLKKPAGAAVTDAGIFLWRGDGSRPQSPTYSESFSKYGNYASVTSLPVNYRIGRYEEVKFRLSPNTEYFCAVYCTVDGIRYETDEIKFRTAPEMQPFDFEKTGDPAQDIALAALSQKGYRELSAKDGKPLADGNGAWYTKYGAAYGNSSGAWCAFFVLRCAKAAGVPTDIIPQQSALGNCGVFEDRLKSAGRWREPDFTPRRGDIIFFDWKDDGNASHVGIVLSADENGIHTVEGNVCADENGNLSETGWYQVTTAVRREHILGYGVVSEVSEALSGDADGNGTVDLNDVKAILRFDVTGKGITADGALTDPNGDGKTDAADAGILYRKLKKGE